jgi:hypothetical protein
MHLGVPPASVVDGGEVDFLYKGIQLTKSELPQTQVT